MDVSVLLEPTVDIARLEEILDGLGHEGRVHATRTWDFKRQSAIFEACKGRKLDLDFMVPPSIAVGVEVIHDLHNTLPLFSNAQKRFCRLPDGEKYKLGGYNEQTMKALTGPGYFIVRQGEGEHEGEIVVDYTELPKNKVASWPDVVPHGGLLGGIVWGNMQDYMRRVSAHVSIGRAHRGNPRKPTNDYFTLVRKDVA